MDITDFLDSPIAFHRAFVGMGVGITGALMLSQSMYWSKRTKDGTGWFYKTQVEWEEETGMTRYEQETARDKLVEMGVLEEEKRGIPCKLFYRVHREGLAAVLHGGLTLASMRESRKLECGDAAGKPELKPQPMDTKITAETTTETTLPAPPAAAPGTGLAVVPTKHPKPPKEPLTEEQTAHKAACSDTWEAYCQAYTHRYGVAPVRNAPANAQIKQLVLRLGQQEAPGVARFYVEQVHDRYVVQQLHPLYLLLRQAEAYRTQWVRGQAMTSTRAAQVDKTAANFSAVDEAMAIMAARDERGRDAYR